MTARSDNIQRRPVPAILEVVCGGMFSGKSEELIRRLRRAQIAGRAVQVFKPSLDDRYEGSAVASHVGSRLDAVPVHDAQDIVGLLAPDTEVVGIDEVQFLGERAVEVIDWLVRSGHHVIVAGLDLDFRGEPFPPLPDLVCRAETVTKLQAICMRCGAAASRSQRLLGGEPAPAVAPTISVGGTESYEARCRRCFVEPR